MSSSLSPFSKWAAPRTSFGVMNRRHLAIQSHFVALCSLITLFAAVSACDNKDDSSGDPAGAGGGNGGDPGDGDGDDSGYTPMGAPCEFGDDADKCDDLPRAACAPVLGETGTTCARDEQCGHRELCFESTNEDATSGVCMRLYGECLPRCAGDFDCASNQECNIESGVCAQEADNQGARFGETCESDDDCAGICVSVSEEGSECEEHCRVGATSGCGLEDLAASNVACAYFAYTLSDFGVEQGAGDLGICATLCNCNDDCPGAQLCSPLPTRGFAGVCTGGIEEGEALSACPDVGAGGAHVSEDP